MKLILAFEDLIGDWVYSLDENVENNNDSSI